MECEESEKKSFIFIKLFISFFFGRGGGRERGVNLVDSNNDEI